MHLLVIYGRFTNIRGYLQFLEKLEDDGGYSPLLYINTDLLYTNICLLYINIDIPYINIKYNYHT